MEWVSIFIFKLIFFFLNVLVLIPNAINADRCNPCKPKLLGTPVGSRW